MTSTSISNKIAREEDGEDEGEGSISLRHYDALNPSDSFETGERKVDKSSVNWGSVDVDVMVTIFQSFDIVGLTSGVAQVCRLWRKAARDPINWKTLDLSKFESIFIKTPMHPFVYVSSRSDTSLTRLLKVSLYLSQGSTRCLIFRFNLYLNDDQLAFIAERCPELRRLVMPAWNRLSKSTICDAIRKWKDLESLTMPSLSDPTYLLEEISKNCNNFRELKIMGPCYLLVADSLVEFLPRLKILSLRCALLWKDALLCILEGLKNLKVLNISHCLLIESWELNEPMVTADLNDESILKAASGLREFITCTKESCPLCKRVVDDEGFMRWYKYEEGLWKQDEVSSLSL